MKYLKNLIIFLLILNVATAAESKSKYAPFSDKAYIKENISEIGILVSGLDTRTLQYLLTLYDKAYKLKTKLYPTLQGVFLAIRDGSFRVFDDGVSPIPSSKLISGGGTVYAGINSDIADVISRSLNDRGYECTYLNPKEFMKDYYNKNTLSEIIDIAKQHMPELDAIIFVFYTAYDSISQGNMIHKGLFVCADCVMFSTGEDKKRLYIGQVTASPYGLPEDQQQIYTVKDALGFKSQRMGFTPSDVYKLFLSDLSREFSDSFDKTEKQTKQVFAANDKAKKQVFAAVKNKKLASELEKLVKCADDNTDNFESLDLGVNTRGGQEIRVKIKSSVLLELPELMKKLDIKEDSYAMEQIHRREYVKFIVDVSSGKYSFDYSLRSSSFGRF